MSDEDPTHFEDRWASPLGPRVMLVDDDDLLRRSTRRFMTRVGFEVMTAASGEDALAQLAQGAQVDVFVVDLDMPGMSGIELLRRLSELAPNVPRGLWSASRDLRYTDPADLACAWFVKDKSRPIGELVQAIARAVYCETKAASDALAGRDGSGRVQKTRSGWVRRQDALDDIDDVTRGSSSR